MSDGQGETVYEQVPFPGWRDSLIAASIETLRLYEPKDAPYWGCFSGGKDSIVIKRLAEMAGVNVEWHYNVTTLDPPELTAYIKRHHPDVARDRPKRSFVEWVDKKGLPTAVRRWCCDKLKESTTPKGRRTIMGVRAAESPRRAANWQTFSARRNTREYAVCPILHWKDSDVWAFIYEKGLPYCKLYNEGKRRLGCVLCPMATPASRQDDMARYPAMTAAVYLAGKTRWERMVVEGNPAKTYQYFDSFDDFWGRWLTGKLWFGDKGDCQGTLELWSNEE